MTFMLGRRRFIAIASVAVLAGTAARAQIPIRQWRGIALGAEARLILAHPDADRMIAAARAELSRLEGIFSLYRPDSALSRLNAAGVLEAPPTELVEVLALSRLVHDATGGLFDPSVQPLWQTHAQAAAAGRAADHAELARALAATGWDGVTVAPDRVALARPGMSLTLNGIAQGYITDRVADRLRGLGLADVVVEMGELRALGHPPDAGAWPVTLTNGQAVPLRDRALASSAPRGTCFDAEGRLGHVIDPRTGQPSAAAWTLVSVSAPQAALADALSTAGCLMPDRAALESAAARFAGVRIEAMA
ncbi:MAG TPA: FAD:protein FMN transferase [Paracoccus sp. (in: a-proteobacteria)]|nr:FAD:protein FMN transferase [Paracoccus sp. (in: a-proteobacteria)]